MPALSTLAALLMIDAPKEIKRHIRRTAQAAECAERAKNEDELRDAWEDFLSHFSKAIGKTITAAFDDKSDRQADFRRFGNRLKNDSTKDDPGLAYLRAARNADEHGLTPPADFRGPHVRIGGLSLGPNSSVSGLNFIFQERGKPAVGPVQISAEADEFGRLRKGSHASMPELVREIPTTIRLTPVVPQSGPLKGKKLEPPESVRGISVQKGEPNQLISAAYGALQAIIHEFETLVEADRR